MKFAYAALVLALAVPLPALAQVQDDQIYGSQMMTQQERDELRAKMRAAQTAEERERIRAEHHALMQERAKERGLSMPEEPPMRGGMGAGMGGGMGPGHGGGMGSGK